MKQELSFEAFSHAFVLDYSLPEENLGFLEMD